MTDELLMLSDIVKRYGGRTVVDNVNLSVSEGQYVTILGPSGSGKTTTIRMIAGHELPDSGKITVAGDDITYLPPQRRPVGMMFQNYALFPHMSVRKNIGFGLRRQGVGRREIATRVDGLLSLMQLEAAADQRPHQLSGGMQQRVALARALAIRPRILLMDEPFSALDARLRRTLRREVLRIHREAGVTTVQVTHDQEEALSMSDLVVVMQDGSVVRSGTPREIYEDPRAPFVADFLGGTNMLSCAELLSTTNDMSEFRVGRRVLRARRTRTDGAVNILSIRPESVQIATSESQLPSTVGSNSFAGIVSSVLYMGGWSQVAVQVEDLETEIIVQAGQDATYTIGERVILGWNPAHMVDIYECQPQEPGAAGAKVDAGSGDAL